MRSLCHRLAALAAATVLALSAAACGSSGSTATSAPGGAAATTDGGTFPASITTAIGVVHVRSRPEQTARAACHSRRLVTARP